MTVELGVWPDQEIQARRDVLGAVGSVVVVHRRIGVRSGAELRQLEVSRFRGGAAVW